MNDPIEYSWQSTPQLWAAHRKSYDGAPDSRCPVGFGKTQEEAKQNLLELEEQAEEARLWETPRWNS